jgi:hypothetical protein
VVCGCVNKNDDFETIYCKNHPKHPPHTHQPISTLVRDGILIHDHIDVEMERKLGQRRMHEFFWGHVVEVRRE